MELPNLARALRRYELRKKRVVPAFTKLLIMIKYDVDFLIIGALWSGKALRTCKSHTSVIDLKRLATKFEVSYEI
jgi:hypothetical protein